MSNEQPPRRGIVRRTGPTLAEFREHLVDIAEQATLPEDNQTRIMQVVGPHLWDVVFRLFIGLVDGYAADHAATSRAERKLDAFSRLNMRAIARTHHMATRGKGPTDLDRLLGVVANDFTLDDVRVIRGVAAALADAMPRIAQKAREGGMSPDEIAAESGYTSSRIAQFLREEKKRRDDAQ